MHWPGLKGILAYSLAIGRWDPNDLESIANNVWIFGEISPLFGPFCADLCGLKNDKPRMEKAANAV